MANKVLIIKGLPASLKVVVKASGSPTPIVLTATDTARAYFSESESNTSIALPDEGGKDMTLPDSEEYDTGTFLLELTAAETALFPYVKGFNEDRSKPMPTCKLLVRTNTDAEAESDVLVYDVFVEDMGL